MGALCGPHFSTLIFSPLPIKQPPRDHFSCTRLKAKGARGRETAPAGKPRSSFRSHHLGLLSLLLNTPARHNKRSRELRWSLHWQKTRRKDAAGAATKAARTHTTRAPAPDTLKAGAGRVQVPACRTGERGKRFLSGAFCSKQLFPALNLLH